MQRKAEFWLRLYASNFIRIQQVFDTAFETGKKVAVVGKSLESYFEVGVNLGYLTIEDDIVIPVNELKNMMMIKLLLL